MSRTEAQKESRRRYEQSDKGRASKKRQDAAYKASGKRALVEQRREAKPLSLARKEARKKWAEANKAYFAADRAKRRTLDRALSSDDFWVLTEAINLAALRTKMFGFAWHVDHIIPVSRGGTSEPTNLQVVPANWNRQKSNKHSGLFFAHAR